MNYGEPFTHTGVLAEYNVSEATTFWGGYTFGWDSGFDNQSDAHTFLGGISISCCDSWTLTWAVNAGNFGDGGGAPGSSANNGSIYMNSFVFDWNISDDWNYVFQHDLGANTGLGLGDNEWYGINQYLFYTLNDCWQLGFRFEWFGDSDGARVAGNTSGAFDANYYAATIGMNWTPNPNLRIRPEIRFDWSDGPDAFAGGNSQDIETFAFDAILTF